jgi:EamA domain-containing membrane protein RarD
MKLSNKTYYYIILHLTVIIWGFTGVLGKLINMPSSSIVLDRMLIAFVTLAIVMVIKKKERTCVMAVQMENVASWIYYCCSLGNIL